MPAPPDAPPRIRTDPSFPFAHHTMLVRVPAILESVLDRNPDFDASVRDRVRQLADALRANAPIPDLDRGGPYAETWLPALAERRGATWLDTDWFFAENYVYRLLTDHVDFWRAGRDPFAPFKREEYASDAHRDSLEAAVAIARSPDCLRPLLAASLFGNRIDLSFKASLERGTRADSDDLLLDDRDAAVAILERGSGPIHLVIDNAGSELSADLVLASALLERLQAPVVLHVKVHPAFVSDAIARDIHWFLGTEPSAEALWNALSPAARDVRDRLRAALASGALRVADHPFWNGPCSLWDLPADLARTFSGARFVILKGDAHYRRAVGDALWPPVTPFAHVTASFPAPLLALRTLKSDSIVGLAPGQAEALEREDPQFRVNGKRGVASLGGRVSPVA